MPAGRPTVVFFPEGAFGPTNNCVGIGRVLRERGARVVFLIEESFKGTLAAQGFEEALMRLKPPPEVEEQPGQFWKDFIRDTAPEFRKPTLAQIDTLIKPIWSELISGSVYVNARLEEIFASIRPDVIVQDNVVAFGAVLTARIPWVRVVSCNPLEIRDSSLPPALSGLAIDRPDSWEEFRRAYWGSLASLHRQFNSYLTGAGCPPLPEQEFMYESPYLNFYTYPGEMDYPRERPLPAQWVRLESCVRSTESAFTPPHIPGDGPLIYLSLGSLGSADVGLMQRLIEMLAGTEFRVVVSMGPQAQEIRLAPNMWGADFLPQTLLLPLVDLVITHGGNNTVVESLYFGKPMVALPLFWDQPDNAQRLHETGFGVRLDPYRCTRSELLGSIKQLLGNKELGFRLTQLSERLQSRPGTRQAADLIERLAESRLPLAARS